MYIMRKMGRVVLCVGEGVGAHAQLFLCLEQGASGGMTLTAQGGAKLVFAYNNTWLFSLGTNTNTNTSS